MDLESPIKTIIVDDEPLARKRLVKLLDGDKEVDISAVCENGMEAIEQINGQQPQLVFLDIQMPGVDGFEVLQEVEADDMPIIIFVTAYDEYALKAFKVHALDYLMKPFKKERFKEALDRAKQDIAQRLQPPLDQKIKKLLKYVEEDSDSLPRILVKSSERYFFLKTNQIDWIEAAGNYVCIHAAGKKHLIRETMTNIEQKLDSDTFFRIHRSAIVNVDKIKELEKWFHGDYKVILENGEKLTMSRNYKQLLEQFS